MNRIQSTCRHQAKMRKWNAWRALKPLIIATVAMMIGFYIALSARIADVVFIGRTSSIHRPAPDQRLRSHGFVGRRLGTTPL